ncbi:MAG: hypothetical protein C0613_14645 [Desulfobulbaceae bacterium]|nr:MAG: hypothetical protein C0613_14645 [Desulfobulbaceae bacterium]
MQDGLKRNSNHKLTMNCIDCQNQFSDFIDDEISSETARIFKGHLASCPACADEWHLFRQTVHAMHSFPEQKVPADFIIGINEKLTPQPFAKLRGWLSLMTQHKLTATSALATLVVGVISAAVLQLSPMDMYKNAVKEDPGQQSSVQTQATNRDRTNYYPNTPYLAANTEPSRTPTNRARVQFTPVKQSSPTISQPSLIDSRGSPSLSHFATAAPPFSSLGSLTPDLVVTVHADNTAYQHALIRQMTSNRNWQTHISGNTLLVTLPCSQFNTFQHLFGPANPHINTKELSRIRRSATSMLTVAVAFH